MILTLTAVTAAQVFTYIGYVIVALLALMVMIVVHELGHYTAGKLLGFKIDEFSIGFGPAIFKKKAGQFQAERRDLMPLCPTALVDRLAPIYCCQPVQHRS